MLDEKKRKKVKSVENLGESHVSMRNTKRRKVKAWGFLKKGMRWI